MMQPVGCAEKNRTRLASVVANRNHVVEPLTLEFVDMLRAVAGNIDADFSHDCDSFSSYFARFGSCAIDVEPVARIVAQQTFRHLAARRVSSAEDQHALSDHATCPSARTATTEDASRSSEGASQRNRNVAAAAPSNCATMNHGA